jgi:hypothetical protein
VTVVVWQWHVQQGGVACRFLLWTTSGGILCPSWHASSFVCFHSCCMQVLGEASPEAIRDAARRCFPLPCRSSYTAISMVPRPPSLLTRALRTLTSLATAPLALLGGKQPKVWS